MINTIKDKIRLYLGDQRTIITVKNIFFVSVIKLLSIFLGFVSVPITLKYLDSSEYGIWLTINSILIWFSIFDIGLSNGLRNKVTQALTNNNIKLCKIYVSTTYFILICISLVCCISFCFINYWLNWHEILNTPNTEINVTILIVVLLFFVRFTLQTINIIFQAHNRYSIPGFWDLFSNILFLLYMIFLDRYTTSSLLLVGLGYSIIFTLIMLIQNIFYFYTDFKSISPNIRYINLKYSKDLIVLSVNFLIIQLGGLFVFSSNNIIISHFLSPSQVSIYNIAFKYFNIVTVGWALILTPYLTSFNEAFNKDDSSWIKKSIQKLNYLWMGIVVTIILMAIISNKIYELWIGKYMIIPIEISLLMGAYTIIVSRINLYGYFINSTGKLKISTLYGLFTIIVNVPLLYIALTFFNADLRGIILVNCIVLLPNIFLTYIQYNKLISKTAQSIWLK